MYSYMYIYIHVDHKHVLNKFIVYNNIIPMKSSIVITCEVTARENSLDESPW